MFIKIKRTGYQTLSYGSWKVYRFFWHIGNLYKWLVHWTCEFHYWVHKKRWEFERDNNVWVDERTDATKELAGLKFGGFEHMEMHMLSSDVSGKYDRFLRARAIKDYKTSDSLRKDLEKLGYKIINTKLNGTLIGKKLW